jgi:hypothetical protein
MSYKHLYLFPLVLSVVSGCAQIPWTHSEMASKPTGVLCAVFSDQRNLHYYDYRIKNILASRGQDECTTPEGMAMQRAIAAQEFQQSMQMLQYSNQLMQMGQPRVLAPPPSQPINCVSRRQGNQVVTNCN